MPRTKVGFCSCAKLRNTPFLARAGFNGVFGCPIVKRSEPAIPWHFLIAIIAFVVAVMKLVIKRAQREATFVFDQQFFITCVGHHRARS